MSRTPPPLPQSNIEFGRVVAPVAKIVGSLIGLVIVTAGSVGAYYSLISRMDRMDERLSGQGRALTSIAVSVEKLANEALTASDLKAACMQMQIANQAKGWVCPFSGIEVKEFRRLHAPRQPVDTEPTPKASWSLFGVSK